MGIGTHACKKINKVCINTFFLKNKKENGNDKFNQIFAPVIKHVKNNEDSPRFVTNAQQSSMKNGGRFLRTRYSKLTKHANSEVRVGNSIWFCYVLLAQTKQNRSNK
jgi:hypothetical protein